MKISRWQCLLSCGIMHKKLTLISHEVINAYQRCMCCDAWSNITFRLKLSKEMYLHGQCTLSNISKVEHAGKSIFLRGFACTLNMLSLSNIVLNNLKSYIITRETPSTKNIYKRIKYCYNVLNGLDKLENKIFF